MSSADKRGKNWNALLPPASISPPQEKTEGLLCRLRTKNERAPPRAKHSSGAAKAAAAAAAVPAAAVVPLVRGLQLRHAHKLDPSLAAGVQKGALAAPGFVVRRAADWRGFALGRPNPEPPEALPPGCCSRSARVLEPCNARGPPTLGTPSPPPAPTCVPPIVPACIDALAPASEPPQPPPPPGPPPGAPRPSIDIMWVTFSRPLPSTETWGAHGSGGGLAGLHGRFRGCNVGFT
jgi:hypothetical protein